MYVDCPELGGVSNGRRTTLLNITIHLIIETQCNTGYAIKGSAVSHCTKGGQWDKPGATCKSVYVDLKHCNKERLIYIYVTCVPYMHTYVYMYLLYKKQAFPVTSEIDQGVCNKKKSRTRF